METLNPVHYSHMFDRSYCRNEVCASEALTYTMSKVTCKGCMEALRLEAIDNQRALDTLPHCPHCDGIPEYVTMTFTVTKLHRFDVQTERDYESGKIKPMLYSTDSDTLDSELVTDKEWQITCENGHEFFTKRIEPSDDMKMSDGQWFVKENTKDEWSNESICHICGCDRSEHNWEAHTAEMKAGY